MDKVIVTALLTMAAVVSAVLVVNALMPTVGKSSSALIANGNAAAERIKANIEIVHIASDASTNQVYVWVKNVGATNILAIDRSDLFLKTSNSFDRLPYGSGVQYWENQLEDDILWRPTVTNKITIHLSSLPPGDYLVRFSTHNGVITEKAFSV